MSLTFKRRPVPLPTHPYFNFKESDSKFYEVSIREIEDKDLEHNIRGMMNTNFDTEKRDKVRVWLVAKSDIKHFLEAIDHLEKGEDNEEEIESESDSTDDELIQKALSRRMKSESSSTLIEENAISDSEMEDVLSISRRLRYIMKRLDIIEKHLKL
jgi:hypothetical protein